MSTSGSERDDDRTEAHPEPPAEPGGVLGNLPRKRPAVRSPRRSATGTGRRSAAARPAGERSQAQAPPRRKSSGTPPDPAPAEAERAGGELEALARGGIAIAGGAAALGLRIAGRAAAAVRDAVERR